LTRLCFDTLLLSSLAQPTMRQQQLARPKPRVALDQDYDPYKVSNGARNAVASPRVSELAVPIPRKVRSKKLA